jgi:hypothetical protein
VGLDEQTGKRGRVRIGVRVDGKPRKLDGDKELTGRDGPLRVRLDVAGAKEVTLVAEFGGFGDVQAHVDWVDARLIK